MALMQTIALLVQQHEKHRYNRTKTFSFMLVHLHLFSQQITYNQLKFINTNVN